MGGDGAQQRTTFRPRVGVRNPRRSSDEGAEPCRVIAETDAEERRPHRQSVARRPDTAQPRWKAQPQFDTACAQRGKADARWQSQQPAVRNRQPKERAKRSGSPPRAEQRACAVMQVCSVSSLVMPRPKKKRWPSGGSPNNRRARRGDRASRGRPRASPTAVPSRAPARLSTRFTQLPSEKSVTTVGRRVGARKPRRSVARHHSAGSGTNGLAATSTGGSRCRAVTNVVWEAQLLKVDVVGMNHKGFEIHGVLHVISASNVSSARPPPPRWCSSHSSTATEPSTSSMPGRAMPSCRSHALSPPRTSSAAENVACRSM